MCRGSNEQGKGMVKLTIIVMFRCIYAHVMILLPNYLQVTLPCFFPDWPLLFPSDLWNKGKQVKRRFA